ncbi:cation:proton antiporter [Trichloromonas sp.]|uniref:cation:proton antiporter n=1 Tax=Trichloromonas sp. TaxID=3069249 RepID=UPI003D8142FA
MIKQESAILLVLTGTAVIPFIARRFRIPSSALEIVYGFLLFNFVITHRPEWFEVLRELGFIFLMFIAGMELDLARVLRSRKAVWLALVPLASFILAPCLFVAMGQPFFLGIAVALISAGIAIPVLKESGLIDKPVGQTIVNVALIGELFSILALTFLDAFHKHGITLEAGLELGKLAALLGLALLLLKLLYLLAWWFPERVTKVMESEDPVEEGIRAVVTVAFFGAVLAMLAGAEAILGSFLAGTIFSYVFRNRRRFEEKINAVGFGFLVPFFFVGVGAQLDKNLLASPDVVLQALFLTLMILVSNLVTLPMRRPLGLDLREAVSMALLLSAPLTMIVVAGTLGMRMGLLNSETNGALILTALLASFVYPSLFRLVARSKPAESGITHPT